jgi:hypothetical protein
LVFLVIAAISAVSATAMATPSAPSLSGAWHEALPYLGDLSSVLEITESDWQDVSNGEVVARRLPQISGPDRVLGLSFVNESPRAVWIAIIDDPHLHLSAELVEHTMTGSSPEIKVLYQLLILPFPLSNRCWVIEISSDNDVYEGSGGSIWRREWRAVENGPAALYGLPLDLQREALAAVYTPVNEGSWTLLAIDGGVIVVYEGRADTAGNLPTGLVDRFAQDNVERTLSRLSDIASESESHYGEEGHYTIFTPNYEPLERQ